ncbi:MAG TPA: hypothetical protein VJC20_01015, partial [Candidatus Paceibacterota bacterium]
MMDKRTKIGDFNVVDFGAGLKDHEAVVFQVASSAINPDEGNYLLVSKEQAKDLAKNGISETTLDEIVKKLNVAIVGRVEETLSDEYKKVLAAIRKDVRPNSEGYYTEDVSYAAIGKQLGMDKDVVEQIMWQLHQMKLVCCYVIHSKTFKQVIPKDGEPYKQSRKTGVSYDSFDVRPWHPDKKIRAIQ